MVKKTAASGGYNSVLDTVGRLEGLKQKEVITGLLDKAVKGEGTETNPEAVKVTADSLASQLLAIPGVDKQLVSDLKEIAIRDGDVTPLLNFKLADGKGRLSSLGDMIGQYTSNSIDRMGRELSGVGSFLGTLVNTGDFTQASRNYDRAVDLDADTLRRLQEQYGKASVGVYGLGAEDAMRAYVNPESDVLANRGASADEITTIAATSVAPIALGRRIIGNIGVEVENAARRQAVRLKAAGEAAEALRLKATQAAAEAQKGRLPPPTKAVEDSITLKAAAAKEAADAYWHRLATAKAEEAAKRSANFIPTRLPVKAALP
jgi:hypothetical protein